VQVLELVPAAYCTALSNRMRWSLAPGPVVKVSFNLPYKCRFGQNLYLVGAGEALGNWDVHEALELKWNPGDVWSGEIAVVDRYVQDLCASTCRWRSADQPGLQ
jgi:hypothetical protein